MLYSLFYRILSVTMECLKSLSRQEKLLKEILETQATQGEQLKKILAAVDAPTAVGFRFTVDIDGEIQEGATTIEMTNSQKATATITPVDAKGNPASIDTSAGGPVWASSDETIVTVVAAADGLSAVVSAVGPLGSAKISVSGDADLGPDTKPIFGTLDVSVTQGAAVGFKIELGTPVEQ